MPDPQPPRASYDPNELRRCIALCFSPKDLRSFAENLGLTNLGPWDRGIQDGAREVVRHFERLGTLEQLVAKLAEARPLMEWPAPLATSVESPFAPPAPPATAAAPAPSALPAVAGAPVAPTIPAETNLAPSANPPTSPFAPQVMSAGGAIAPVKPIPPPTPTQVEPVLRDPFAPAFPGTAASSAAADQKRLEGKKLAPLIAGAVVLITIVTIGIFLAVRVGKNPEASNTQVVAGRPMRSDGPARMAADAMKRSLESLARGCDLEIPRGTDVDTWLFSAAYAQCGTRPGLAFPPPGLRVDKPRSLDTTPGVDDPPPNADVVNTPRQTNPGRNTAPKPVPAPGPAKPSISDGCLDKCSGSLAQCNRACGSEPSGSSEFDRWQSCKTQCLSTASKCRLACQ